MTRSIPNKVEARMILNPVRADGTTSVSEKYIKPNTVIELISVSIGYARNSIPTATATVAMGRKNDSDFRVAVGHPQIRRIVRQVDVLIEAKLEGRRNAVQQWPSDFFTVFDGFTSGVNLKRAEAEGSYQIQMTHWLGRLLESSVLSNRLHPSAPAWASTQFNNQIRRDSGGASNSVRRPDTQFQEISDDLWGKVVLPFLTDLAADDKAFVTALDKLQIPVPETSNRAAFKALKRFLSYDFEATLSKTQKREAVEEQEGQKRRREVARLNLEAEKAQAVEGTDTPTDAVTISELKDTPVQSLNEIMDTLFGNQVRDANNRQEIPVVPVSLPKVNNTVRTILGLLTVPCVIRHLLTRSTHVNDTFWGRLLRVAQAFQVSILPAMNNAAVLPSMPHGTRTANIRIPAGEIFQVTGSGTTDRIPRGMALYSRASQSTHGQLGAGGLNTLSASPPNLLGRYDLKKSLENELENRKDIREPENKLQKEALEANAKVAGQGMWLFRVAPMWLDFDGCLDKFRRNTIRRNGLESPQFSWAAGVEKLRVTNKGKRISDIPPEILAQEAIAEVQFIGDRFARWALLDEMFQRRVGVLNGRFRVDIMPGSTILFDTMGVNITNLPFVDAYSGRLQGTVNQVTLTLDAENAIANTTLMMSHLRNESELATESFSPIRHPVFNQEWRGGPLVGNDPKTGELRSLFIDTVPIPFEEQQRANTKPVLPDAQQPPTVPPRAVLLPSEVPVGIEAPGVDPLAGLA